MQSTESVQRDDRTAVLRRSRHCSTAGGVLLEAKMSPVLVIQVDNATPIVLNREKSDASGFSFVLKEGSATQDVVTAPPEKQVCHTDPRNGLLV